jgi:hypothetical protein
MKHKKNWILIGTLLILVLFIHLVSTNALSVEQHYSTGLYPYMSSFFRALTGWLPFSLGDLLYGVAAIWLLWKVYINVKALLKNKIPKQLFFEKIWVSIVVLMAIYIFFNLFWGINYNRQGIASQLGLKMEKYTPQDLKIVDSILLKKVNANKAATIRNGSFPLNSNEIFKQSCTAYNEVYKKYPFLQYHTPSVKVSLWGWLGNYLGFTGYYNPFTGEAQVNTTVPKFLQPYITCHEIAHQLGYAKENEANFVGYLAAASSKDSLFLYSVYLDLFLYADRNLYSIDSAAAKSFAHQLLPEVKADLKEVRDFNRLHKNPAEPVIRWLYGKYLQSNQQPSGVLSYDEVTGLLIAYYKKYGTL